MREWTARPSALPCCPSHCSLAHRAATALLLLLPQIHGLPTLIFIGMDASKPALRTEGLLPAQASASRKLLAACLLPACCLLSPGGRPPLRGLRPFCPAAAVSERVPLGCDWVPPFDLPCCQVIQEIVERDLVAGAEEQKAA